MIATSFGSSIIFAAATSRPVAGLLYAQAGSRNHRWPAANTSIGVLIRATLWWGKPKRSAVHNAAGQVLLVMFPATAEGTARARLVKWDTADALLWDDVEVANLYDTCAKAVKLRYHPYGQEVGTATANDTVKFATYTRDAHSGVDYAMNRYYMSTWGRFTTADPYRASGGPADPGSWNRYAYVQGDPVNYSDPSGLASCPAGAHCTNWGPQPQPTTDPISFMFYYNGPNPGKTDPIDPNREDAGVGTGSDKEYALAAKYLQSALGLALTVIDKPECQSIFGTAESRSGDWNPKAIVSAVYSAGGGYLGGSGVYGGYKFLPFYPYQSVATAGPAAFFGGSAGFGAVGWRVEINVSNWVENAIISIEYAAAALLHEIGHIYSFTWLNGSGGSQLTYDAGSATKSEANQELILKKCFGL